MIPDALFANSSLPESRLKILESGSLGWLIRPALKHDVVQGRGTVRWQGKPLAILYLTNHFIVFDALEWLDTIHEDLPHTHT